MVQALGYVGEAWSILHVWYVFIFLILCHYYICCVKCQGSLDSLFNDTDSPVLAIVDSQFCPSVRFLSDWSYFVLFICVVRAGAGVVISKLCW